MNAVYILLAIYFAGVIAAFGYSNAIWPLHKQLSSFIKITLMSWYGLGCAAGMMIVEKRQKEAAYMEAVKKQQEQMKHQKPLLYKPN